MTSRDPHQMTARMRLARFDEDQASLQRARDLLAQGRARIGQDPRGAFELIHRSALRGAGVLVARADRSRKRKLPRNVWIALERIGGEAAERAIQIRPYVAERVHLERDQAAQPDPLLLRRHLEETAQHLDRIADLLVEDLPAPIAALAG